MISDGSWTPLTVCAKLGYYEHVKLILNFIQPEKSALHLAVSEGHLEIVKLLAQNCHLENMRTENGNTLLHAAALKNQVQISKFLKSQNPNLPKIPNISGFTPLHYAAENGHLEVVKVLLENQENPGNMWGNTPLHYAATEGHTEVVEYLLGHLVEIYPTNHLGD